MISLTGSNKRVAGSGKREADSGMSHTAPCPPHPEFAFTFVELMVTVVILAVGLVLIIQGFTTAIDALNTMQNNIQTIQFLDAKMQELETLARINNGIKVKSEEGKFSDGIRDFAWNLEIISVEKEEDIDLSKDLNEVRLKVNWQERKIPKDLSIVTYLRNKKE